MLEYNFEKSIFKEMTYVDFYCNNIWNLTGKMLCSQQCCGRTPLHNYLCEQITFCFQGFPITRQGWLQVEHVREGDGQRGKKHEIKSCTLS